MVVLEWLKWLISSFSEGSVVCITGGVGDIKYVELLLPDWSDTLVVIKVSAPWLSTFKAKMLNS